MFQEYVIELYQIVSQYFKDLHLIHTYFVNRELYLISQVNYTYLYLIFQEYFMDLYKLDIPGKLHRRVLNISGILHGPVQS